LHSLFRNTSQKHSTNTDNASVTAIFRRRNHKVRIFLSTNEFVAFTEFSCDVDPVFLTSNFCANPTVLVSRRWQRGI
jgi:hypothetical protein